MSGGIKIQLESLVEHTLFEGFTPDQLQRILDRSTYKDVHAGELLVEMGITNSTLYVLYDGEIHVIIEEDGTNLVLPVWPGECIGEMSLILDRPTSAYAVAQKSSKVLLIPEDVFWEELISARQGVKNLMSIMTQRLKRNNQALMKRMAEQLHYQNLQKELKSAGKIQASMIPDIELVIARYPQVDIQGILKQTSGVGGDFYDVMALDEDHIYIAIGDASGKGMMAALFMVRALTALRMTALNRPFQDLFQEVNTILMRNNPETMFVTLFAGMLNVKTGSFQYLNAGHNPTIGALGGEPFKLLAMPEGSVLGVTSENIFTMGRKELKPGDTLVMYTDGVTEATGTKGEPFGETRLLQLLNLQDDGNVQKLVRLIEESINTFISGAAQYDDLTLLAVKYLGPRQ